MHSCLTRVPIFQHLSSEDMGHIHQFIRPKHFKKGGLVQIAGRYAPELLILNRGNTKVYRPTDEGGEQIIRLLKPGDYLGETAVFAEQAVQYDALALEDSSFCTLSKDSLSEILRSYPELVVKLLGDMSRRLQSAETQLEQLGQQPVQQRLLDTLREYANGRTTFTLPVAKKDFASQIGIRPETLSRQLKRLDAGGQLQVSGRKITFL